MKKVILLSIEEYKELRKPIVLKKKVGKLKNQIISLERRLMDEKEKRIEETHLYAEYINLLQDKIDSYNPKMKRTIFGGARRGGMSSCGYGSCTEINATKTQKLYFMGLFKKNKGEI